MKKTVMTLLMAITSIASAFAYGFRVDGICYNLLANGTVEVTYQSSGSQNNYSDLESTDVVIPEKVTYGGTELTVVRIGNSAFALSENITSIVLPNTITEIGNDAFKGCRNLSEVTLSNSLTSIGTYAFESCSKLENIALPNSLVSLGDRSFYCCYKLQSIIFPESVTSIGVDAMQDCSSLKYAKLPSGITAIPRGMFFNCTSFTSLAQILIPNSIVSIGQQAFYGCKGMQVANIPESITSIGDGAFWNSGLTHVTLPSQLTTIEADAFNGCKFETISIPNSVKSIGNSAFGYNYSLKSIVLPPNITSLSSGLFQYCGNLESVEIPQKVKRIEGSTFLNCSSLIELSLSDSITYLGGSVFSGCTSLKKAHLPKNITTIPSGTFYYCKSLTDVDFPLKVYTIGERAFQNCEALKSVDSLFTYVTEILGLAFLGCKSLLDIDITAGKIYNDAFSGCSNLKKLTIGKGVTYIGASSFSGCTSLDTVNIYFPEQLPEPPLRVPNTLTIGQHAFYGCGSLTTVNTNSLEYWCKISFNTYYSNPINYSRSISLNNEVVKDLRIGFGSESIADYAFYDCDSLVSVKIDEGVKSIGNNAFSYCRNLKEIDIPSTVTVMGDKILSYSGLTKLLSRMATPPSIDLGLTDIQYVTIPLYIPEGSESAYSATTTWNKFARQYTFGEPEQVTVGKGTDLTKHSFMANWGGSSSDSFDLYVYKERETVREDFDNATVESLQLAGWQFGEKVDCDDGALRLGTSSVGGRLTTPSLGVFSGDAALSFDIKAYPNAKDIGKTVDIVVLGSGSSSINSITTSEEYERYNLTISGVSEATKVILTSHDDANNRFLIDNVVISTLGTSSRLSKATFEERFDNEALTAEQLTTAGWQMVKGFVEDKALRLGTSSVGGEVTTPALGAKRDAVVTLDIKAYPNNKDLGKIIDVSVVGEGYADITDITTTADFSTYTISLTGITEETKLKLASHTAANNRFIIDNLMVISGKAVWQLLEGYPVNTAEYSHEVTGLEPGSSYSYYVIAKNEIGDEAEMSNIQIVSTLPGAAAAAAGDINGDASVDGNDVSILLEMVLAGGVNAEQMPVADINGDNSVDGNDVSILLEMVLSGN